MDPKSLRFSKQHEWVAIDGAAAIVGISDHAQQELGDIVFVELPEVGRKVSAGEVIGTIESVKAVSELYTPVSGTVAEVNAALDAAPELLNSDAYGEGWILKLTIADTAELEALMDHDAYADFTG